MMNHIMQHSLGSNFLHIIMKDWHLKHLQFHDTLLFSSGVPYHTICSTVDYSAGLGVDWDEDKSLLVCVVHAGLLWSCLF